MKTSKFCKINNACDDGEAWAIATGAPTIADLWKREDIKPEWRIWIATRPGVMSDKSARLFACWCVRQVWHLLTDERSRNAVEAVEKFANGEATAMQFAAAGEAAREAARDAAGEAARDAQSKYLIATYGDEIHANLSSTGVTP